MPRLLVVLCISLALSLSAFGCGTITGGAPGSDGGPGDGTGADGGSGASDGGGVPVNLCDWTPPPGPTRTLPEPNDPRSSKAIYDEYFGQYMPEHEDFGWEPAPWITVEWVESRHFPTPSWGLHNETYHNLFDFNPFNYERPGLAALDRDDDNVTLFASDATPEEKMRRYDPTEWMPAVGSTYARSAGSDVMANQFWYRARTAELRPYLERALELCPDCDDVFTPLSKDDMYKILEIRFVRFTGDTPEVSRIFKVIGVDSSGAMESHTHQDSWNRFGTIDGQKATAKWRMELSGLISQRYWDSEEDYISVAPVLVRASMPAILFQYYDGEFDRDIPSSDPYERVYNSEADGDCIRDCHGLLCQAGRNVEGYYYRRNEFCECSLSSQAITTLGSDHAAGRCEEWPADAWPDGPSSTACGD